MPSKYNFCVPLSINHYGENLKLSFNRISEDKRGRNTQPKSEKRLKLEFFHTWICSAHFGGNHKYPRQLQSTFPWSNPVKLESDPHVINSCHSIMTRRYKTRWFWKWAFVVSCVELVCYCLWHFQYTVCSQAWLRNASDTCFENSAGPLCSLESELVVWVYAPEQLERMHMEASRRQGSRRHMGKSYILISFHFIKIPFFPPVDLFSFLPESSEVRCEEVMRGAWFEHKHTYTQKLAPDT